MRVCFNSQHIFIHLILPFPLCQTLSAVDLSGKDDIDGSHKTTTPNVPVLEQSSASTLHDLISTRRVPNDEVIDWIMNNVDDAMQTDGSFIREIANAVLCSAFEGKFIELS